MTSWSPSHLLVYYIMLFQLLLVRLFEVREAVTPTLMWNMLRTVFLNLKDLLHHGPKVRYELAILARQENETIT